MQELEKTYRTLRDWMMEHPKEVLESRFELQERLHKKRFFYGDSTMPTTMMPLFLKPSSLERIRRAAMVLDGVIDKVVRLYFEDERVRSSFPLHFEIPRAWFQADPGYEKPTMLNRLDVLFDGENLKFIEFNTDNPGGKGWVDVLEDLFINHPLYKDFIDFSDQAPQGILAREFEAIMGAMEAFGAPKPRIALVAFDGSGGRGDEEIVRDYFIERGVEANLLDPRDFELRSGGLYSNGVRFHGVIRCMTSRYFLRYPREMRDFITAVTEKRACMVNSFRAQLGSEKSILSFLSNPLNHDYFSDEEIQVIRDHIPWTRKFDETVTLSPEGEEISIKAYMLNNRERLVLKPSSGAGGEGVLVGKACDPVEWMETIEDNAGSSRWIVQEYAEIPRIELPVIKKGEVVLEEKFLNLSPYVFGGRYAGILGRVSSRSVINVSAGGGLIPVFPLKEQNNEGRAPRNGRKAKLDTDKTETNAKKGD